MLGFVLLNFDSGFLLYIVLEKSKLVKCFRDILNPTYENLLCIFIAFSFLLFDFLWDKVSLYNSGWSQPHRDHLSVFLSAGIRGVSYHLQFCFLKIFVCLFFVLFFQFEVISNSNRSGRHSTNEGQLQSWDSIGLNISVILPPCNGELSEWESWQACVFHLIHRPRSSVTISSWCKKILLGMAHCIHLSCPLSPL